MFPLSRRQLLKSASGGFGMVALAGLLGQQAKAEAPKPLAPREPHRPAKAKRLIFVHMNGAMSHHDTFDYKPKLVQDHGKGGPGGGAGGGGEARDRRRCRSHHQSLQSTPCWVQSRFREVQLIPRRSAAVRCRGHMSR